MTIIEEIEMRKQKLANSDYIACKIAEGEATAEEYKAELAKRRQWRAEIDNLEKELYKEVDA